MSKPGRYLEEYSGVRSRTVLASTVSSFELCRSVRGKNLEESRQCRRVGKVLKANDIVIFCFPAATSTRTLRTLIAHRYKFAP